MGLKNLFGWNQSWRNHVRIGWKQKEKAQAVSA